MARARQRVLSHTQTHSWIPGVQAENTPVVSVKFRVILQRVSIPASQAGILFAMPAATHFSATPSDLRFGSSDSSHIAEPQMIIATHPPTHSFPERLAI